MKQSGIYEIVNTANGKKYVGSAIDLAGRKRLHLWNLNKGSHHSRHLQSAWNKHGEQAFEFKTLLLCSKDNLLMYEQRVIDAFTPAYNIEKTAGSALGVKRTKEQRQKLSKALTGIKYQERSAEVRAAISKRMLGNKYSAGVTHWRGRKHSPEALAKMAAWPRSEALRDAVSAAHKGNKYWLGRKHSAESIEKMSASKRGKQWSDKRRLIGMKPLTPEQREKQAAALRGKPWSDARRAAYERSKEAAA